MKEKNDFIEIFDNYNEEEFFFFNLILFCLSANFYSTIMTSPAFFWLSTQPG